MYALEKIIVMTTANQLGNTWLATFALFIVALFVSLAKCPMAAADEGNAARPNVLFIAVDDLRPELG